MENKKLKIKDLTDGTIYSMTINEALMWALKMSEGCHDEHSEFETALSKFIGKYPELLLYLTPTFKLATLISWGFEMQAN